MCALLSALVLGAGAACCEAVRSCTEICLKAPPWWRSEAAAPPHRLTQALMNVWLVYYPSQAGTLIPRFRTSNIPFRLTFLPQNLQFGSSQWLHLQCCHLAVGQSYRMHCFRVWWEGRMVSSGWKWGGYSVKATLPFHLCGEDKDLAIHLSVSQSCRLPNVGTWQSGTARTKQEYYFNLPLPLIPTSAIIRHAQLCVPQPPPYEQSITVSASLMSALAPLLFWFFFTCIHTILCLQRLMLAQRAEIHNMISPRLTLGKSKQSICGL